MRNRCRLLVVFAGLVILATLSGCTEGFMLHQNGWNPWVRKKWAEDEAYIETLHARRDKLRALAANADQMPPAEQERVSRDLVSLLNEDSIVLLRLEAIRTLGAFQTSTAANALHHALKDGDPEVRIAAVKAFEQRGGQESFDALATTINSDTNIDVRLAATRAMASYRGPAAEQALAIALDDKDPALQYRAMQSLRDISDRDYGNNAVAWREYLRGGNPAPSEGPSIVERLNDLF